MTDLRIAMVGWEFPPLKVGGLAVHCYNLAYELACSGVKVDFFMPKTPMRIKSPHSNISIIPVTDSAFDIYLGRPIIKEGKAVFSDLYIGNVGWAIAHYSKLCSETLSFFHNLNNYSLIHGHDWITVNACLQSKQKTNLPWVHSFHSTEYDRNSFPWDFITGIEKQGVDFSDLIITVSSRMKQILSEKYSADRSKIRVIYNGINPSEFAHNHNPDETAKHLRGKKIVLFLGRLTHQKGPEFFLHTAKKVLEKRKDVVFVLGGKGELLPHLINLSIRLGIVRNVMFLGYIPDELQSKIYSMADVFVMPSTSEPFGITALEAMASGVPTIMSKTSGVSELVKTAFKIDFWDIDKMADTIIGLVRYPIIRRLMAQMEIEEIKKFSWKKVADETISAYLEAIQKTRQ